MTKRLTRNNLQVSETLVNFIENDALPNTNVSAERFWNKLELILNQFVPLNQKLLETRSKMKKQIDSFYLESTDIEWAYYNEKRFCYMSIFSLYFYRFLLSKIHVFLSHYVPDRVILDIHPVFPHYCC